MNLNELRKISKALVSIPSVFLATTMADVVLSVLAENGIQINEPVQVLIYLVISLLVGFIVWRVPNKTPDVEITREEKQIDWSQFEEENKKNE